MVTFAQRGGVTDLLAYIQSHPGQRAGKIAAVLNLSQRTIERRLKQPKENGLIAFRGAAKIGSYYYNITIKRPENGINPMRWDEI